MGPDQPPVSFLTLEPRTSVVDRFGHHVGKVERVLVFEGGGFDGLVVETDAGKRFVDAPEVRRISGGAVTLGVTVGDVEQPGTDARKVYGLLQARHDRTEVTEDDRDAVIDALKSAYVDDRLTTEELGERVTIAHVAETLAELDSALEEP
jgi:Domain of unknown function (DUF1707)